MPNNYQQHMIKIGSNKKQYGYENIRGLKWSKIYNKTCLK